jgi:hypothetical protein
MAQRRSHDSNGARAAARAEQQKEARDAFVQPQAAVVLTEESAKGIALVLPLCVFVGALLAAPLGLIEFGSLELTTRVIVAAVCGAVAGAVVGLVAGPSLGARRKARESAGAPRGRQGRPGKAEVAEATGEHEDDINDRRRRTAG